MLVHVFWWIKALDSLGNLTGNEVMRTGNTSECIRPLLQSQWAGNGNREGSDMARPHSKAEVPSAAMNGSSVMWMVTVSKKGLKRVQGRTVLYHSLEEQQGPDLSQEAVAQVQTWRAEQTEPHE